MNPIYTWAMSKKNKEKVAVAEEEKELQKDAQQQDTSKKEDKKDPMEELKAEVQQEKDRYLRLFAEFENYKKRTGKERLDLFKTASQDVMVALLPILDDMDRALVELKKNEDDSYFTGVELISNKLKETLRQKGLEVMKVEVGDTFDAEMHEAITQIPAPEDNLKGKIIDVIEKGYTLGERIIRYPKVVIGQ